MSLSTSEMYWVLKIILWIVFSVSKKGAKKMTTNDTIRGTQN